MSAPRTDGHEDRIEGLLRAARPEPAAPLSEERAQEIFARALALSGRAPGAAEPAPAAALPWWRRLGLPPLPAPALWGGTAGAVAACSLAALLLLRSGSSDAPNVVAAPPAPHSALISTAATVRVEPSRGSVAPAAVAEAAPAPRIAVQSAAPEAALAAGTRRKPRPSAEKIIRRPRPAAPPTGPRVDRPATMLAANEEEDDAPRLLVVASGALPAGDDGEDAAAAEAPVATDPFVVEEEGGERLIVAVAENVPASRPGRAEAAALREWPIAAAAAGPAGPAGSEEGPALSGGAARPTLVWAQASVASDEEPTLVLTEMPAEEPAETEGAPELP